MSPRAAIPPAPGIDAELKTLLRRVKLGRCLDTLPERLTLGPHPVTAPQRLPDADPR
jgi:hypothetical protein